MMSFLRNPSSAMTHKPSLWGFRRPVLRTGVWVALVLSLAIVGPVSASAQEMLRVAKAADQVGERLDGFLGVVDQTAPAKVKKLVEDTNNLRRDRYMQVATIRGSTLESVGKQAASILYKRATKGQLLQMADGTWQKKK